MIARNLISDTVPSLKTSDTAKRVMDWMNEFKVNQLPVVNNEELLGLITEEDLLEISDEDNPIGNVRLSLPEKTHVYEDAHIYDVIRVASMFHLDVLPVLKTRDNTFLGVITKDDIVESMAKMLNVLEPGGIIILEVSHNSYHLSEIARLCESNDAKVLSLTVANAPNPNHLYVSVKLNIREMSRVIATFERFDYTIHNVVFDSEQLDDYKERYENLIRFLNL